MFFNPVASSIPNWHIQTTEVDAVLEPINVGQ
jgi:hypothetical protein